MRTLAFLALAFLPGLVSAQNPPSFDFAPTARATSFADVADFDIKVTPAMAKPGQVVTVKITITPKLGCWTYPANPPPGQSSQNFVKIPPPSALVFITEVKDPKGFKEKKGSLPGEVMQVYYDEAVWEFLAVVDPKATSGKKAITFKDTRFQACNKDNCFYYPGSRDDPLKVDFEVLVGPSEPLAPDILEAYDKATKPVTTKTAASQPAETKTEDAPEGIVKKNAIPFEQYKAKLDNLQANLQTQSVIREGGLWTLLATAALWGLISLVTPCVFPMIPITVSLFLKQSNQSVGGAVKLAGVYCLTIIAVLGLSAITLLTTFRALSVNPIMNIGLGIVFMVLALSLFGMFDITLPNFMLRAAEGKRKSGGVVGAVFGAIAFSIVSFTCVAPFLGGFAGMASSGQYTQTELILAGLAFAAAFASPFFILALFPSLIKKLPKSGGWLDTVKAVMGFLEIAAAIKFFRTAELRLLDQPVYLTYDVALTGFVITLVGCGLYLLNVYRLPHDEEKPNISAPRLMFALLFLGMGVYLYPGTFKGQRPTGIVFAWVDAFLLPEPDAPAVGGVELPWRSDLPDALEHARKMNNLVFVDFTGVTCTNCKDNERNVFPKITSYLKKYTLVQMYTDEVPAAFYLKAPEKSARDREALKANLAFQLDIFGTEQLPLYAILEPLPAGKARVVAVYNEGKINNKDAFKEFLQKHLERK